MPALPKSCYVSTSKRVNSKRKKNVFHSVECEPWYSACAEIGNQLKSKLEVLNENLHKDAVNDVIEFISKYQLSTERVLFIALFTGVDLCQQNRLLSMITNRLEHKNYNLIYLNATKTTTLKSLVEDTVLNFITSWNAKKKNDDMDVDDDDDDINRIKKSECTLLRLVNWYRENFEPDLNITNEDRTITYLVIVIPNILLFPKDLLNSFVHLLRKRLPFILLSGIPTVRTIIHKIFSKDVESKLAIYSFQSKSAMVFLDNVLKDVFLTSDCQFQIGSKAFHILTNAFLNYHFSVKEFIRGIQFCLSEHFSELNISIVGCTDGNIDKKIDLLEEDEIDRLLELPSMQKYNSIRKMENQPELKASSPQVEEILKNLFKEFRCSLNKFHLAFLSLKAVLKFTPENSIPMYKHYIEVTNRDRRNKWLIEKFGLLKFLSKENLLATINHVLQIFADFPNDDENTSEIKSKLTQYRENIEKSQIVCIKNSPTKVNSSPSSRGEFTQGLQKNAQKRGARSEFDETKKEFLDYFQNNFIKVYLKSTDDAPLRELFIFEDEKYSKLKYLCGYSRAGILTALETPVFYLECDCCDQDTTDIDNCPDLALVHKLHKEWGNKINMYDWFQQFRSQVDKEDCTDDDVDPEIYSRFLQAVRELHYLGFITLPKSRANFVEYATRLTV